MLSRGVGRGVGRGHRGGLGRGQRAGTEDPRIGSWRGGGGVAMDVNGEPPPKWVVDMDPQVRSTKGS